MNIKSKSEGVYKKNDGLLTDRLMIAINEINEGDKILEIGAGDGTLIKDINSQEKFDLYAVSMFPSQH